MLVSTFYKKKSPQKSGARSEENDQGPDHGEPVEQTSAEGICEVVKTRSEVEGTETVGVFLRP